MNFQIEYERKQKIKEPIFSFKNPITSYMKVTDVLLYLNKNVWCTQYELVNSDGTRVEGNYFKCVDLAEKLGAIEFRYMEAHVNQYLINTTK